MMGDDIDDLLDEVEASFVKKPSNKKNNIYNQTNKLSPSRTRSHSKEDELSTLMDEICDIPDPIPTHKMTPSPVPATALGDQKRRCFTIYLGGSAQTEGITTTASQRACDKLRCTACDFKISVYKDFMWDSSTDYLFLRNNMPDFGRLKSKLNPKTGYTAYACQCQWRNINKLTELSKQKDLKWVCGKH